VAVDFFRFVQRDRCTTSRLPRLEPTEFAVGLDLASGLRLPVHQLLGESAPLIVHDLRCGERVGSGAPA
jgi:hypothetical protein